MLARPAVGESVLRRGVVGTSCRRRLRGHPIVQVRSRPGRPHRSSTAEEDENALSETETSKMTVESDASDYDERCVPSGHPLADHVITSTTTSHSPRLSVRPSVRPLQVWGVGRTQMGLRFASARTPVYAGNIGTVSTDCYEILSPMHQWTALGNTHAHSVGEVIFTGRLVVS